MATEKQAKMLAARSKEAGIPYDFKALLLLENGDVDKKLAEIAAHTSKAAEDPKPPLDKIRFGLAAKMIMQNHNIAWCSQFPEDFSKKVGDLYEALMMAEDAVRKR